MRFRSKSTAFAKSFFFLSLSFGLSISGDATGKKEVLYGPDSRFLRGDGLRDPGKNTSQ